MTTCEIDDIIVAGERRVRVRGWPGAGGPLIPLHGVLDSSAGWEGLAAGTHRPCVAFDLPGVGGLQAPREHVIDSYADDIVSGFERLGLESVTLVGHSLGDAVATSVAERCPDVSSLALLAPAGFGPIPLAGLFVIPGIHRVAMTALPLALMTPPLVLGGYMAFVSHGRRPTRELVLRIGGDAWPTSNGVRAAVRALHHSAHAPDAVHRRRFEFDGPVAAVWGATMRSSLPPGRLLAGPSQATGKHLRDPTVGAGVALELIPQRNSELIGTRGEDPTTRCVPRLARRREAATRAGVLVSSLRGTQRRLWGSFVLREHPVAAARVGREQRGSTIVQPASRSIASPCASSGPSALGVRPRYARNTR